MGTKYYVSSSTCSIFDPDGRVDNFQAAMLDFAANSTIELYEYMKMFYTNARLHDMRMLLKWCEDSGYFNHMGRVTSSFYSASELDPVAISEAIRADVAVPDGASFQVQSSSLDYFSEHNWIKHCATKQGKADLFYEGSYESYDLEFPDASTIRAVFKSGATVEGTIPSYSKTTRFLNVEFSIINPEQIPTYDEDGNPIVDEETGEAVTETLNAYSFGYYSYPEGSGNTTLDNLIASQNTAEGNATFYPAIPIRTDTHWFSGTDAKYIGQILQKIRLYDPKEEASDVYGKLTSSLTKGIKKGGNSMGDIDYMTILIGCAINSTHPVDLSYIYGFFKKLYDGYDARFPKNAINARGIGDLVRKGFAKWFAALFGRPGSFVINNGRSNLNLTYKWTNIFIGECTGKWKPDAKMGSHGVLAGNFPIEQSSSQPKRGSTGEIIYQRNPDTKELEPVYEMVTSTRNYHGLLFCHQKAEDVIEYVGFANLELVNLVYHGKTVDTDAYDSFMESSRLGTVTLAADDKNTSTFYYVKYQGDTSAFVVPLEQTSFYSIPIKDQMDLTYGCTYLVINCWVKVKTHSGLGSFIRGAICLVGAVILAPVAPLISTVLYFAAGVFLTAAALELTQKILCKVFGEKLGNQIYGFIIQIIKAVLIYVATVAFKIPVFGWIIWGICMAIYTTITIADYIRAGYSVQDAFKKGMIEGAFASVGSMAGGYIGGTAGVAIANGAATAGSAYANGDSIGRALAKGVIAGGASYIGGSIGGVGGRAFGAFIQGTGTAIVDGANLRDALKLGGLSAGVSLGMSALNMAYDYGSSVLLGDSSGIDGGNLNTDTLGSNTPATDLQTGMSGQLNDNSFEFLGQTYNNPTNMGEAMGLLGNMLSAATVRAFTTSLTNPMTYVNLLTMSIAERQFHKMANLMNDYQEFNNKYKSALEVMDMMYQMNNSSMTAEFLCKMQLALGRFGDLFPESTVMSPEEWLSLAITSGHDQLKAVMLGPSTFVDSQLTMEGYEPYQFHYTVMDFAAMYTEDPYLPYL